MTITIVANSEGQSAQTHQNMLSLMILTKKSVILDCDPRISHMRRFNGMFTKRRFPHAILNECLCVAQLGFHLKGNDKTTASSMHLSIFTCPL